MNEEDEIYSLGMLLESRGLSHSEIDSYFEHFGVRGMKWGVRRTRRAERLARWKEGSGKASWLRSTAHVGPIDLVKGRGIRGGTARKAMREVARENRRRNGEATTRDRLARIGNTKVQDLVPVRASKANKETRFRSSDKAVVAAAGALIVARMIGREAMRRGAVQALAK